MSADPVEVLTSVKRRAAALSELTMQSQVARVLVEDVDAECSAFVLDQLVRGAVTSDPASQAALLGLVFALLSQHAEADYDALRHVYEVAASEGRNHLRFLLLDLPPHRAVKDPRTLLEPRLLFDRDVSLGERKAMAVASNRRVLEKLMADYHPHVVHKLCLNPALREADIVSLAARRPNLADALRQIALTPKWLNNYAVRYAIVSNPYTQTGITLKLLPFLHGRDLRRVAQSSELHPAVAQAATELLHLRSAKNLKP